MAWCFSTKASVATVLTMHPCVSWCLRVNESIEVGYMPHDDLVTTGARASLGMVLM